MSVTTRQDLISYCLRKLGAPVITIDVAQEQVEDRLDEAIQFFQDYHYDGTERVYLNHQVTGSSVYVTSVSNFIVSETVKSSTGAEFKIDSIDLLNNKLVTKAVTKNGLTNGQFNNLEIIVGQTSGASTTVIRKETGDIENRYVPVSDMVTGVIRAVPWFAGVSKNSSSYMFDPQYQIIMSNFQSIASSSMIYYSQMMSHLSLIDQVLRPIDSLRFNRKTNKIYLDFDWNTADIGSYIIFEVYRILDPEEFSTIYNDRMLKKLVTAKIKYQWAQNTGKFAGVQLLGGVTVDASTLMAQAVAEISSAESEIKDAYSLPSIGFCG